MRFDSTIFQSQYKPRTIISPYLCGIACLTMILKYYNQVDNTTNYIDILNQYLKVASYNVPFSSITLHINKENLQIPIIYYPKASANTNKQELIKDSSRLLNLIHLKHKLSGIEIHFPKQSNKFIPSFSLWYGFDHRGITQTIDGNNYKIHHELIEKDFSSIVSELKRDNSTAILSINPTVIGTPITKQFINNSNQLFDHQDRHDIVVFKITKYQGKDVAIIADPSHKTSQSGIQLISVKTLKNSYTGHASIFSS